MFKLLRQILVIAMLGVMSAGTFAQKKDQEKDKRPIKEPAKVITNDRKDQRQPRDKGNQQPPPKGDKRGKPDKPD